MTSNIAGSRVLVTGASSGIGQALADLAARRGARVLLVARSAQIIQGIASRLASENCQAIACPGDVTSDQDRLRIIHTAQQQLGGLDILVNNAGILATGHFADATSNRLRQIMETNFFAAAELTRLAIPLLRQGNQPTIVNIASITGRRAVPARAEYSASKFALVGLSESIRAELAKDGIHVLVVNPCFVNTQLETNTIESKARREWQDHKLIDPRVIAERTLDSILRGKHEITVGATGRMLLLLNRLFPRFIDRLMARYVKRLYQEDSKPGISPLPLGTVKKM
jgi:short-subunit dehydrogenase